MSRKNRNGNRKHYTPKNYTRDFLKPTHLEQAIQEANAAQIPAAVSISERVSCDDKCSYEYKQLPAMWLETDFSYQRKIDAARVNRIVDHFDPRLANEVKVSFRDGKFFVFDGAHTLSALKQMHGDDTSFMVDCKVYYGLTYEDEAYLFALQSGESKEVAFNTRLRALMISGSAEAAEFKKCTAKAGFQFAEGKNGAKNTIAAIAKAYKLYKDLGEEKYIQILQLVQRVWSGAPWSLTGYILGGVAAFLQEYGAEYKPERFVKRLAFVQYGQIREEARRQQHCSADVAHAMALVHLYNQGGGHGTLNPRRLLDWK